MTAVEPRANTLPDSCDLDMNMSGAKSGSTQETGSEVPKISSVTSSGQGTAVITTIKSIKNAMLIPYVIKITKFKASHSMKESWGALEEAKIYRISDTLILCKCNETIVSCLEQFYSSKT